MSDRLDWSDLSERRMSDPRTARTYEATRIAFELGREVRQLREGHSWSQSQLALAAGMTQSAVARFEAGGTVPTLPVLLRLAGALEHRLDVRFMPNSGVAHNDFRHASGHGESNR
ncbi:multiprotein-bridging factor 1 family protein [Micromonospora sp. NPDC050795]|uniref:multiprotein-bridging factor 1 family protein n=1 Tax=Micromonospora sp. NPDC050795 TaxID=3364282 RepID=UPI003798A195